MTNYPHALDGYHFEMTRNKPDAFGNELLDILKNMIWNPSITNKYRDEPAQWEEMLLALGGPAHTSNCVDFVDNYDGISQINFLVEYLNSFAPTGWLLVL